MTYILTDEGFEPLVLETRPDNAFFGTQTLSGKEEIEANHAAVREGVAHHDGNFASWIAAEAQSVQDGGAALFETGFLPFGPFYSGLISNYAGDGFNAWANGDIGLVNALADSVRTLLNSDVVEDDVKARLFEDIEALRSGDPLARERIIQTAYYAGPDLSERARQTEEEAFNRAEGVRPAFLYGKNDPLHGRPAAACGRILGVLLAAAIHERAAPN